MKVVGWIVVIAVLGFFIYKWVDRGDTIGQLRSKIEQSEQREGEHKKDILSLNDSVKGLKDKNNELSQKADKYYSLYRKMQGRERDIIDAYRDSLDSLRGTEIEELINESSKIIRINDTLYIALTEEYYRSLLEDRLMMRKLKARQVVLKNKLVIKDSIIEVRDDQIFNLIHQLAVKNGIINKKDTIITEKELQNKMLEEQSRKYRLQRNITMGAAGVVVLLFLL